MSSRQIAGDLDIPLERVNEVCQKREDLDPAHIEKRTFDKGRVKAPVAWIKPRGIDALQKEHGTPI